MVVVAREPESALFRAPARDDARPGRGARHFGGDLGLEHPNRAFWGHVEHTPIDQRGVKKRGRCGRKLSIGLLDG